MQEEINQLKKQIEELQRIVLSQNILNRTIVEGKTTFKDIATFEKGIRLVHKKVTGSSTFIEIYHGSQTTDAGIKAEIGYTSPYGSIYITDGVPLTPVFVMVFSTWTAITIP